jgi:hypothetical protein
MVGIVASFAKPNLIDACTDKAGAFWFSHFDPKPWTVNDARHTEELPLQTMCQLGDLTTARWLHTTFDLTADDSSQWKKFAGHSNFAYGHTEITRWIDAKFGITESDDENRELSAKKRRCK